MHLAFKVLLTALIASVINWIGKSVVLELSFSVYSSLLLRASTSRQKLLKKQILENKAELLKTSSQDEFAKWAKLRRKVDKGLSDLEKLNSQITASRTSFSSLLSTLLFILTSLLPLSLIYYYRSTPVFYIPSGWVPYPIAWLLCFGGGKMRVGSGGVSVVVWSGVCREVIRLGGEIGMGVMGAVKSMRGEKGVQVGPAAATKNSKSKPIPEKKTLATPISATTGGREPQPEQEGMD